MWIFVVVFWLPHLQTVSRMWMAKVFLSRKQRAPLRFASPVSDLGVAVEFWGGGAFFLGWFGRLGGPVRGRRGEEGKWKSSILVCRFRAGPSWGWWIGPSLASSWFLGVISGVEGMQNTQLWPEKHLRWSIWEIYWGGNGTLTVGLKTRDDRYFKLHVLVSRRKKKERNLVLAFLLTHGSERWKPLVAVMHQSTFTLREDFRRQGRSDGGDIRRGHAVSSVSCLAFLLEDANLCVHHRTGLSVTDAHL